MTDPSDFGFGRFVPGFDFLQNIAKGATQASAPLPNLSSWVAPTLSVEELDKRISELKAVHFWLEQNGKALAATIQALEVQRMTLATLQGMNFSLGEMADALKLKPEQAAAGGGAQKASARPKPAAGPAAPGSNGASAAPVDPLQWWGALTQQFQEIAAQALKEVGARTPADAQAGQAAPAPAPAPAQATQPERGTRKAPARKRASKRTARGHP